MSNIGVTVSTSEALPTADNPFDTSTAFFVGFADAGPGAPALLQSIADFPGQFGPRSATNATLYDAVDTYFREGGSRCFVEQVLGAAPTRASAVLAGVTSGSPLTVTAAAYGVAGNSITVSATNSGATYTLSVTDPLGNLYVSPALSDLPGAVAWAVTTGVVTITTGSGGLPGTQGPLPLLGGGDDRAHASLTNWETALAAFSRDLGPGQVLAPGQTNTTLPGIWGALAVHALSNNRAAIGNLDDGQLATTEITDIKTDALTAPYTQYIGLWAGNLVVPGATPGTTRVVTPDCVVAALCARADHGGNPNQAAAGQNFPLIYVLGFNTIVSGNLSPYSDSDISKLNDFGVNTFKLKFGLLENYGFVSAVSPTVDEVFCQFSAVRLRMALQADFEILAEPFVFSQNDGGGSDITKLNSVLQNDLQGYWKVGALFGASPADAFSVDTGPTVNTIAVIAAKQLKAVVSVRISPFAQQVRIELVTVPITQVV